ncbi:MAG TPA: type II secretion system F family protein [Gemmatimonadaceae bacterium]|nr:type II secretion system F family protein [Gemmatimonadaceae bacterium]
MQRVYAFEAIAISGATERGSVDAETADAARASVSARGLFVMSIEDRGPRRERRQPIAVADLALGFRMLADLVESGLPVARALQIFEGLAPKSWGEHVPRIRQEIREGRTLASALDSSSLAIPPLVIGIIQSGEAGAGLGPAIRRAAELSESSAEMRAALRSALAYPTVVALAGVLAITVLITVVLPRFATILSDLGQTLPTSTRLVLRIAAVAHASVIPVALGLGIVAASWRAWIGTTAGLEHWHRVLLGAPLVGTLRLSAATARAAMSLSALLGSGVPIATALGLAARASGDAALEARILRARARISGGDSLSTALAACDACTPTAVSLIRAGEESGSLVSMLEHASRIEQKRVDQVVRTAVRMLEPMLLLTFASVVALIAAALLQAIYSVRPAA